MRGGTDVRLAQGTNAIDIASGGVRARGAGINTDTFAFIHQTAAANICADAHFTRIENPQTFSATANLSGLLLFAQQVGNVATKPVSVRLPDRHDLRRGLGQRQWLVPAQ